MNLLNKIASIYRQHCTGGPVRTRTPLPLLFWPEDGKSSHRANLRLELEKRFRQEKGRANETP